MRYFGTTTEREIATLLRGMPIQDSFTLSELEPKWNRYVSKKGSTYCNCYFYYSRKSYTVKMYKALDILEEEGYLRKEVTQEKRAHGNVTCYRYYINP